MEFQLVGPYTTVLTVASRTTINPAPSLASRQTIPRTVPNRPSCSACFTAASLAPFSSIKVKRLVSATCLAIGEKRNTKTSRRSKTSLANGNGASRIISRTMSAM
jgi:hypothetical protein